MTSTVTLIEDKDLTILVDTGNFESRDLLVNSLCEIGLSPEDIDVVVLTHLHWDHCLNVDLFNSSHIIVNEKEMRSTVLSGLSDKLTGYFKNMLKESSNLLTVNGNFSISDKIEVIELAGHTEGSMGVKIEYDGKVVVITGDAIPNLRSFKRGIPDFIFYDSIKARKTINKVKKELKPDIIIPGHDIPFNFKGKYIKADVINFPKDNAVELRFRTDEEKDLLVTVKYTSDIIRPSSVIKDRSV